MAHQKQKIELNAQPRTILGSKVKNLRKEGLVPAVLYGNNQDSIPLQIPLKEFNKVLKEAGESTLVYVQVDGQAYPTIIHDVTRDALTDAVIHADFRKVRLDQKIKAMVPVVFEGESPAVKELGGIFVRNVNELEVEALPQELPHEIAIDISGLKNLKDQILLKDVKMGDKVKFSANEDDILATIQEPLSEEELKKMIEGDQKTVEDVEVIEKVKPEEVPAEEPAPVPAEKAPQEKAA
ncbi:MAG TPA: 50S ribosomal protein L25 [Candidatus Paceibacterota bacterium]